MLTIGEFSVITKLSVKTLRYYHEQGLLVPDYIDEESSYRYYRKSSVDKAAAISLLRDLDFTVNDISGILRNYSEDSDICSILAEQKDNISSRIVRYREAMEKIELIITTTKEYNMKEENRTILEKQIDDIIFAGYRFKGKYSDVGNAFRTTGKAAGRFISGSAMSLYYDSEYRENDADIEGGFPVSKKFSKPGIDVRVLKGGRAVTIKHYGPYETLGNSYTELFSYINEKKYSTLVPSREIYLKGPGMIFRGNPEKYITEIQLLIG
jgi:DNA-binding transcriptional MerR regulator